ncbi:hypothetical protein D3C74_331540 [compost metagenome]
MGDTAVDHGRARDAAGHRTQAGLHLGDHAGLERGQQRRELGPRDLADERGLVRPRGVQALDVGQDDELLGAERDRERRGRRVGVDVEHLGGVVEVRCDGRDDRDASGVEQVLDRGRVDLHDVADQADVDGLAVDHRVPALSLEQAAVLSREPDRVGPVGVDEPDELSRDLSREDHADDVHGLGGRDAQPAAELALDTEPREHRGDLGTAAVDDHGVQADLAQEHHVARERGLELVVDHGVAAVLDDHERPAELLEPGHGLQQDLGLLAGGQVGAGVEHEVLGGGGAHDEYALFSWT